jgi:hypothetical protein
MAAIGFYALSHRIAEIADSQQLSPRGKPWLRDKPSAGGKPSAQAKAVAILQALDIGAWRCHPVGASCC